MAVRGVDRGYFDAGVARPARATYGLPDAPSDNYIYGRQNGQWVIISDDLGGGVVSPATELPLPHAIDAVVGVSVKYAREDHVHPETVPVVQGGEVPSYLLQEHGVL